MELTFKNIVSFAIEKEKEAVEVYKRMSALAKKPNAKAMFDEFTAEEVKHRELLEGITEDSVLDLPLKKVTDLKISDYLIDMSFNPDIEYQDALIIAMKREEGAVKLYSDLMSKIQEPELKKLLEFMVQEEAKHKLRLETEYDENVLVEG